MKRTWIVIVQQGCGHELHDSISDSEFYGPYTKEVAKKTSAKLCEIFAEQYKDGDGESMEASAYCLENMTLKDIASKYKQSGQFAEDDE